MKLLGGNTLNETPIDALISAVALW